MKKTILFLFIAACVCKTSRSSAQVNAQDSVALVNFYDSTNGSTWLNRTNWLTSAPVRLWHGITVLKGRVTAINLSENHVAGILPITLGNLSALTTLAIEGSKGGHPPKLTGSIPTSLGNLSNLVTLDLSNNSLTGAIPSALGNLSALVYLDLNLNPLSGAIPFSLGNLSKLNFIDLANTGLVDTIPSSFQNLSALQHLDLEENKLTGNIPSGLGNLSGLTYLSFYQNNLSGTIPSSLGNLSHLDTLDISVNDLTGNIPLSLGNLTAITYLDLGNNKLSGTIPSSLGNLTGLIFFDLEINNLNGAIPSSLGNLVNLNVLGLGNDNLSGTIPASFSNLHQLSIFSINGNNLTGNLPNNLSPLLDLDISDNKFRFTGIDAFIQNDTFRSFVYTPQANVPLLNNGGILSVSAGGTLASNTYKWYNGSTLIATNVGDSSINVPGTGNYWVDVTNTIATQLTLRSDTVSITIPSATVANLTVNKGGAGDTTKANFKVVLSSAATGIVTIHYATKNGTALAGKNYVGREGTLTFQPGQLSKFIAVDIIGDTIKTGQKQFYLELSNPVNAVLTSKDSSICIIKSGTGLFDDAQPMSVAISNIKLYPNPAKDMLNISLSASKNETAQMQIVDVNGNIVFNQSINLIAGASTQSINVSKIAQGNYFVEIKTDEGMRSIKFVKE